MDLKNQVSFLYLILEASTFNRSKLFENQLRTTPFFLPFLVFSLIEISLNGLMFYLILQFQLFKSKCSIHLVKLLNLGLLEGNLHPHFFT